VSEEIKETRNQGRREARANVSEDKKETRNEGRRRNYEENAVAINAARREAHKGTYNKTDYTFLQGKKSNLIYHLQRLESTDSARSSEYTLRKRLVDDCFAEIQNKYLVLCNKNQSIAAMYEYVEFLEEGERYGVNPDYEAALKYLNKAANLGHSYAHLDLSDIHGGDYWCSYPNLENDLAISFEHLVSASLCSAWD